MSSAEFVEWIAFERLEGPLGPARDDWRYALIAAMVANANRDPKKKHQPYKPQDFIPDWAKEAGVAPLPKPDLSPQEVAAKVRSWARGLAAKGAKR